MQTLRLFCDVARCRSFSQAALEHGITQSAASQRIGALEKRLGAKLLDRSVRPLALTPAGELFYREGLDLLQRYQDLQQRVMQLDAPVAGHIYVEAIYSAGIDLLHQVKLAFEKTHPTITVEIDYRRPDEVYEAVRRRACDLGIVAYPQRWREVSVIHLRHETMVVVCRPSHPLAHCDQVHASELHGYDMVSFDQQLPVARRIRRYLREHHADPRVISVFDNIDTIKHALTVTDCVAILPKRTVLYEMQRGVLNVVPLEPKLTRPLGIILPRSTSRPVEPTVQAFIDFLLQHAGPDVDLASLDRRPAQPQFAGESA